MRPPFSILEDIEVIQRVLEAQMPPTDAARLGHELRDPTVAIVVHLPGGRVGQQLASRLWVASGPSTSGHSVFVVPPWTTSATFGGSERPSAESYRLVHLLASKTWFP